MIIDPHNPLVPLDKYHNPAKMINPYGTFHTHVQPQNVMTARLSANMNGLADTEAIPTGPKDVLSARIDNSADDDPTRKYSKTLLKQAYSNIHPRAGVNITLNNQIRNMKRNQIEYYANEAGLYLKRIHDSESMDLTPENIWNLKDIANPKNHEYFTNKQGRSHITPDDFLDLNGKSDRHLDWDAKFWEAKSIGDQSNVKQQKRDHAVPNQFNMYNYHAKKYAYYSTYPWINPTKRKILQDRQRGYMDNYENKFNHNYRHGSKSWLSKINLAKGWLQYHQNKLYYYNYYHPKFHAEGQKVQKKLCNRWQKILNEDIQHKNQDYHYYQEYLRQYRQRKYNEMMQQHWNEIKSQVHINTQNNFTSIYCADGMDTRVVRVAEISPTEDTSMNVPVKSIDNGMPQTDWVQISQSQLSGPYNIYLSDDYQRSDNDMDYGSASPSYNNRVAQYHILKRWGEAGKLLAIQGFNSWHSILISDIQRTADQQSSANGLQMNLTFIYARLAHIKYAKNKKAPGRPVRGRHQSSDRNVKVKAHDTFSGFATRYGGTIGEWERANPHAVATDLQIGSRLNKPKEAK